MSRLILDAIGGGNAPHAALKGAAMALSGLAREKGELLLVGDESVLRPILRKRFSRPLRLTAFRVGLRHAPQNIDMEDPVRATRSKPNATVNVGRALAVKLPTLSRPFTLGDVTL